MSFSTRDAGDRKSAIHVPALFREAIQFLDLHAGQVVVDGTVGAGGHSRLILERIGPGGTLIGLDRDPLMLQLAASNLPGKNVHLEHASYREMLSVLEKLYVEKNLVVQAVDRILLDLGLCSDQLADKERGFSFDSEGPLDLRYDRSSGQPAWQLIETLNEQHIVKILEEYGEERFSRRIARELVSRRKRQPVRTARDLVEVVRVATPAQFQRKTRRQPATRVFQAFRIAVNDELEHLESAFHDCLYNSLSLGGRIVVIAFHSLEDRIVKQAFRGTHWKNLTPKPITARPAERRANPRSRSAKLRAAMKT